jgi:energy-coupling factor transport system substrate-specific component
MLAVFAGMWGMLFGFITNLYFWPFFAGELTMSWEPGSSLSTAVMRYLAFYGATSLAWDVVRALGNIALVAVLGLPTIRALRRFRDRFQFEVDDSMQLGHGL